MRRAELKASGALAATALAPTRVAALHAAALIATTLAATALVPSGAEGVATVAIGTSWRCAGAPDRLRGSSARFRSARAGADLDACRAAARLAASPAASRTRSGSVCDRQGPPGPPSGHRGRVIAANPL